MKKFLALIGLALALPLGAFAAGEQDYQSVTLYTVPSAFPTGTASNIAGVVNCTMHDAFTLTITTTPNATGAQGANNINIRYSIAADANNWPAAVDAVGQSGWFSIPLTNNTSTITWSTNITMNTLGYWRLDYLTNGHSGSLTSGTVRAFFKPKRTGTGE